MNQSVVMRQWWSHFVPTLDFEELVPRTLTSILEVTQMEFGFVLLKDHDSHEFVVHSVQGLPAVVTLQRVDPQLLAELQSARQPILVGSLPSRSPLRRSLDRLVEQLTQEAGGLRRAVTQLCLPLHAKDQLFGLLATGTFKETPAPVQALDIGLVNLLAEHVVSSYRNAAVHEETCLSFHQMVEAFAECIDTKGPDRRGHSKSVAYYSGLIGRQMGLSEAELEWLELAGYLHDIGKLFLPEEVLNKPGKLTDEEFEMVRGSIPAGADLLKDIAGLTEVAQIVRYQSENWDGTGYPEGLEGETIPVGARILSVASRFTAMLSRRTYRKAMSLVSGAMSTLREEAGTALDPHVVKSLFSAMGRAAKTPGAGRQSPAATTPS